MEIIFFICASINKKIDCLFQNQKGTVSPYAILVFWKEARPPLYKNMETAEEIPSIGWFRQLRMERIVPQKIRKFNRLFLYLFPAIYGMIEMR